MEDSHKHENFKDSEIKLGTYGILDKGEKGGKGSQLAKVRTGDLQVIEEGPDAQGRLIFA